MAVENGKNQGSLDISKTQYDRLAATLNQDMEFWPEGYLDDHPAFVELISNPDVYKIHIDLTSKGDPSRWISKAKERIEASGNKFHPEKMISHQFISLPSDN